MILVTAEHVLLQETGADIMGLKTVSTQPLPEVIVILMSCDVSCTLVAVVHHCLGFLNLYMRPGVCGSVVGGCNQVKCVRLAIVLFGIRLIAALSRLAF